VFVSFGNFFEERERVSQVFTRQRENWAEPDIVALAELDMWKMRVRFVLAREAIRERMRELEHPGDHHGEQQGIEGGPDNCRP
jgi:hypothetical protein